MQHNLEIALRYVRQSKAEKEKAMQLALGKVNLPGFQDRKIYELSGANSSGERLPACGLSLPSLFSVMSQQEAWMNTTRTL